MKVLEWLYAWYRNGSEVEILQNEIARLKEQIARIRQENEIRHAYFAEFDAFSEVRDEHKKASFDTL